MADEKILDSEKLEEEQLENVAGGKQAETDFDRNVLFNKGFVSSPNASKAEVAAAFAVHYGIIANLEGGHHKHNSYTLPNGQTVNHATAWAYIQTTGK